MRTARELEAEALANAKERQRLKRLAQAGTPLSAKGTGRVPARLRVKAPEPTVKVTPVDMGTIVLKGKYYRANRAQRRAYRG